MELLLSTELKMKKNKQQKEDRADHIVRVASVIEVLKGNFKVKTEDAAEDVVLVRLSGKMRQNKINVLLGDRVEVKFSVYDTINNGIISKRL